MPLILVRHGESEANARGIIQGRLDFGLSELGRLQAQRTAERFAERNISALVTSPLLRAAQTADIIGAARGMIPVAEPALVEYDVGEISGLTGAEIRERHPGAIAAYARGERPRYPGEEGRSVFRARLEDVLARLTAGDPAETIIAVAHGGVVSAVCHLLVGLDLDRPGIFQVANCSVTTVGRERSGRLTIAGHNDVCHLAGIVSTPDRG
ncbi:MAG: histidine phosphatase family protein [Tepidiformaceae bacterium]